MQNLLLVMLGIIALAIGLFVALVVIQPANTPPKGSECVIQGGPWEPSPIQGFVFDNVMRADSIFEGERNSITTSCLPAADAPFEPRVESFGITIFNLARQDAVIDIKKTLTPTHISEDSMEQITIHDKSVTLFENETEKIVVLFWEEDLKFVYLEVAGVFDDPALSSLDETQMKLYMETLRVVATDIVTGILGES